MQGNALINWIIDSVDNANYRKGALTGWKHPKVDAKMIAAVGRPRSAFATGKRNRG